MDHTVKEAPSLERAAMTELRPVLIEAATEKTGYIYAFIP